MNVATKFQRLAVRLRAPLLGRIQKMNGNGQAMCAANGSVYSGMTSDSGIPQSGDFGVRNLHGSAANFATGSTSKDRLSSPIFNVQDEEDFKKRVMESKVPVVVDFHATWCGPCKLLGPRLETLISSHGGKVMMAKVDIDERDDLAEKFQIRSVPTVLAVKDGKVVDQFVGLADDDKLSTFLDKLIK